MRFYRRSSLLVVVSVLLVAQNVRAQVSRPIKWACIGNSITASAYPGKLATLLGPGYTVENDGVSGSTMLKTGKMFINDAPGAGSYWTLGKLANVFTLNPDIITIALGTCDSKPMNWADSVNFIRDYMAMIDTLSIISRKPQIWLCLPCPAWVTTTAATDISGITIKNSIIPRIRQVAATKGLDIIDLNTPMTNLQSLFPDNIHPDDAGADSLAAIIYRTYISTAVKICCIGNRVTQYIQADGLVSYPYPAKHGSAVVKVFFPTPGRYTASLTTVAGVRIFSQTVNGAGAFVLQPGIPASGVYILRVVSQEGQTMFGKIVEFVRN